MIESPHGSDPLAPSRNRVELSEDTFLVDAELIGELLRLEAARVPALMREGEITSACERGVDVHAGEFRLTFFYGTRRARLNMDSAGRILRKSVVDFGQNPTSTTR